MKCKYCGKDCGSYELCRDCHYDLEDELIDKCKCGNYKDSEYEVCKECYNKQNKSQDNQFNGLSKRKGRYTESMIKGRIAEALIEELFLSLGYNVFRYGMENTVPGIMKLLKEVRGDVANNIRRMPDFVIQKPGIKEAFFVEVKFRKNEMFSIEDLPEGYPFENAYFIIVSKKHIKCITYKELADKKEITPEDHKYLGNRKEFELDKDVIIDFCNFAVKFFENV